MHLGVKIASSVHQYTVTYPTDSQPYQLHAMNRVLRKAAVHSAVCMAAVEMTACKTTRRKVERLRYCVGKGLSVRVSGFIDHKQE